MNVELMTMPESDLQSAVLDLARLTGWLNALAGDRATEHASLIIDNVRAELTRTIGQLAGKVTTP